MLRQYFYQPYSGGEQPEKIRNPSVLHTRSALLALNQTDDVVN